jgi:hypothetical protein
MENGKHVRPRTALIDGQSVKTKHKVTSNITPQSLPRKFLYINLPDPDTITYNLLVNKITQK